MMKRQIPYLFVVIVAFVFVQCGQRGSPTGGPDDVTPPIVELSSPLNNSTNFSGKEVSFTFDEYVKVSGFYNEFVISPPVATPPKFKLKGKRLILTFEEEFAKNTTYNIFLGKAVKDLNKGNVLLQNQMVFSTGDYVDSLSFSGNVYDAQTMQGETEGMVHLYKTFEDSVPSKEIPAYFAQVINGKFQFNNLAPGKYKIFALSDINSNYLFDLPNEKIAYQTELIEVQDDMDSISVNLIAFETQNNKQFIESYSSKQKGKVVVKFNNPVSDFSLEILNTQFKKDWNLKKWNEEKDSLILFSTELMSLDSFSLVAKYDDQKDTLDFNYRNRITMDKEVFHVHHNKEAFSNPSNVPLRLEFNKPIASYDVEKMRMVSGEDTSSVQIEQQDALSDLIVKNKLGPAKSYVVSFFPGALKSIFGDLNKDTLAIVFTTAEVGALSDLVFEYDFSAIQSKGILEFWEGKKRQQVFYIKDPKGKLNLSGILPAKYKFKFIADEDGNKRWSAGDYWLKKQPEKVYWYKEEVNVRANWEMEIKWVLIP